MEPRHPQLEPHWAASQALLFEPITHADKAQVFIDENEEAWELFEQLTKYAVKRSPSGKVGAKFIFEKIRWQYNIVRRDADFKINNNFTAYFARKFMESHKKHALYSVAFNTREAKQ